MIDKSSEVLLLWNEGFQLSVGYRKQTAELVEYMHWLWKYISYGD